MSDQVPFRFFRSRCRFRCMLRFQKNAMHIGLTGFAESTVMRYLFCIEGGFVSRRCICSFNAGRRSCPHCLAILPESGVPADADAWKDLI